MIVILEDSRKVNPFFSTTNTPFYDNMMGTEMVGRNYNIQEYYRFEKGVEGKIEYITADEYFSHLKGLIFSDPYNGVSPKKVEEYAKEMKSGDEFPLPYLNLSRRHGPAQEGRHRMLAASKVYGRDTKFPVLVVRDSNPTDEEILDYANKKYPKDPQWVVNYVNQILHHEDKDTDEETNKPELNPTTVDALFVDEGNICDFGDGLVRVDEMRLSGRSDITIIGTELSTGDSIKYELDDSDKVTVYFKDRNPHLYE